MVRWVLSEVSRSALNTCRQHSREMLAHYFLFISCFKYLKAKLLVKLQMEGEASQRQSDWPEALLQSGPKSKEHSPDQPNTSLPPLPSHCWLFVPPQGWHKLPDRRGSYTQITITKIIIAENCITCVICLGWRTEIIEMR